MAMSFKGAHVPQEIILMGVRWYLAYPLSTRDVEELMLERGVHVDHSTINRWVVKYSPYLDCSLTFIGSLVRMLVARPPPSQGKHL
jgi:transposase-like protein